MQGGRRMSKVSLGEKEQEFLEALRVNCHLDTYPNICCCCCQHDDYAFVQSFYFDNKPAMSNEEFDNLKEELTWEGSKVAVLRYSCNHVLLCAFCLPACGVYLCSVGACIYAFASRYITHSDSP